MRPSLRLSTTSAGDLTGASRINPALVDLFGRGHNYLRVSLTERCNLRCQYCMPEQGVALSPDSSLLTLDERKRLIHFFVSLGVDKIRFTGGEPTISKDLLPLVRHCKSLGVRSISITSNGVKLKEQIADLVEAGLSSVNVSLDTLQPKRFAEISRRPPQTFGRVMSAIFAAQATGVGVKVNCVVMRGVNDDELGDFVRFGRQEEVTVRFIELMPFDGNRWDTRQFVGYYEMVDGIQRQLAAANDTRRLRRYKEDKDPHDTTKWFVLSDDSDAPAAKVGFITSMTSHFCAGCNRLRLTADGSLKNCLFSSDGNALSLRDLVRQLPPDSSLEATAAHLVEHVQAAVRRKAERLGGHSTPADIASSSADNRPMILIGG